MRLDDLSLWHLGDPTSPRYVGVLKLISAGMGVSLRYGQEWPVLALKSHPPAHSRINASPELQ